MNRTKLFTSLSWIEFVLWKFFMAFIKSSFKPSSFLLSRADLEFDSVRLISSLIHTRSISLKTSKQCSKEAIFYGGRRIKSFLFKVITILIACKRSFHQIELCLRSHQRLKFEDNEKLEKEVFLVWKTCVIHEI